MQNIKNSEDLKTYLTSSSEIAPLIQKETDLHVTDNRVLGANSALFLRNIFLKDIFER